MFSLEVGLRSATVQGPPFEADQEVPPLSAADGGQRSSSLIFCRGRFAEPGMVWYGMVWYGSCLPQRPPHSARTVTHLTVTHLSLTLARSLGTPSVLCVV